jgi:hypothetical protein
MQAPADYLANVLGERAPAGGTWVAGGLYRLVRRDFVWGDAPSIQIEDPIARGVPENMRIYAWFVRCRGISCRMALRGRPDRTTPARRLARDLPQRDHARPERRPRLRDSGHHSGSASAKPHSYQRFCRASPDARVRVTSPARRKSFGNGDGCRLTGTRVDQSVERSGADRERAH